MNRRTNDAVFVVSAALMLALGLACGGIGVAVEVPLEGSFSVSATDADEDAAVGAVPPTVYAWGDDEHHVIVKRRPRKQPDAPLEWWILTVEGRVTDGPFSDDEIAAARERLGVSPDLALEDCLDSQAPADDEDVHRVLRARLERFAAKEPWLRDRSTDPARTEAERQRWRSDLESLENRAISTEELLRRLGGTRDDD